MDAYRRMVALKATSTKLVPHCSKQISKLNNFETKVDNGAFHLKTNRGNFTCYLCSWSIRNISSFHYGLSKGFQDGNCFSYDVSISVVEEELNINICSKHYSDHHYTCFVTVSTDLGEVLFRDTLAYREISKNDFPSYERTKITKVEFQKLKQLPNDTIVFTFKLVHSGIHVTPSTSTKTLVNSYDYLKSLQAELKKHQISSIKDKVMLCVGTETEFVNKAIICARSPVFSKMFQNDMLENGDNKVIISDIEMPVLKALVSFLNSGLLQEGDFGFLFNLYYSASKYQIAELQLACTKSILDKVSLKNIYKVLNLALQHNDEIFKSAAMALICANFETLAMTTDWQNFMLDNPETGLMASTFFEFKMF